MDARGWELGGLQTALSGELLEVYGNRGAVEHRWPGLLDYIADLVNRREGRGSVRIIVRVFEEDDR